VGKTNYVQVMSVQKCAFNKTGICVLILAVKSGFWVAFSGKVLFVMSEWSV